MSRSSLFQRSAPHRSGSSGIGSSPVSSGGDVNVQIERENDEVLKALREDIRTLKGLSSSINQEVRSHNALLDVLHSSMDAARSGLRATMTRLDRVSASSGVAHMWILLVFAFGVCFFVFLLLKFR